MPLRLMTAAALTALLLSPLTTALVPATLDAPGLAPTQATLDAAAAVGAGFAPGTSFGDLLARSATRDPAAAAAGAALTTDFPTAMAQLYAAAGLPPGEVYAPAEPLASALAPVIAATAHAGAETNAAYGDLTAEERAFLLAHLTDVLPAALPQHTPEAAADADRAAQLAQRVDAARMGAAAQVLAQAMDTFARTFGQGGYGADSTGTCLDSGCMVELGNTAADVHDIPRVLIIDLGGADTYKGAMATSAPGLGLALPVSAILDLDGNDVYTSTAVAPGQYDMNWAQGVGVGGIGLLLDVQGDDTYDARLANAVTPTGYPCPPDYSTSYTARQLVMAQGVGVLGVGAVLDVLGNDKYSAVNTYFGNVNCHWGKVYTWAQGVGLHFGVGGLFNVDGRDTYYAFSEAAYVDDNMAMTTAQGAGAGGIGVLADAQGSDSYAANSYAHLGTVVYRNKGGFAWTFAQGSVLTTPYDPSSGQFQPIAPKGVGGVAPPPVAVAAVNLCRTLGQAPLCDSAGVGLLVEGAGSDRYSATATSTEPLGCGWTSSAVVSGQGSAAWSGLGALLNLDVDTRDTFTLGSSGTGGGCWVLGSRAHTYGQGFGGSIYWPYWEFTAPDTVALLPLGTVGVAGGAIAPLWTPAVGILVNVADLHPPGAASALSNLLGGPGDGYYAYSYADNFWNQGCQWQCPEAIAETWAQGSAGNLANTKPLDKYSAPIGNTVIGSPLGSQVAGTGVGIGIQADALGDDTYHAQSWARSIAAPAMAQARTVAQGAAVQGLALLGNVGGRDTYTSLAYQNGANIPAKTQAQGYAEGLFTGLVGCVLVACAPAATSAFPAVGIQLDVGGMDTYTEAGEPGSGACQGNQKLWGTVLPACVPLSPAYTGRGLGVDDLSTL